MPAVAGKNKYDFDIQLSAADMAASMQRRALLRRLIAPGKCSSSSPRDFTMTVEGASLILISES